jgi:O-antigen ligase
MNTTAYKTENSALPGFVRWTPFWVLAFVASLPWPGVAEAILSFGAVVGVLSMLWHRFSGGTHWLTREAWAVLTVLFLGYWLPEFFSAFDAVNSSRAWKEVAADLRYLPFLWLCAVAVSRPQSRRLVFTGIALIAMFWLVDAGLQAITGISIGGAPEAERLTGVFGAENPKLGPLLATLSPFVLLYVLRSQRLWLFFAIAVSIGVIVLLSGARAAWISYSLVLFLSLYRLFSVKQMLLLGAGLLISSASAYYFSDALQARVERTLTAELGSAEKIDHALSGRLSIWETSVKMIAEHPINGVGIRGFRDAYPVYADSDDWFIKQKDVAFHAHHWLLEVLSETGVVGLFFWALSILLAYRAWRWSSAHARAEALAPAIALIAIGFPLNTHLAFFSTYWGSVWLLLIALFAGSLGAHDRNEA